MLSPWFYNVLEEAHGPGYVWGRCHYGGESVIECRSSYSPTCRRWESELPNYVDLIECNLMHTSWLGFPSSIIVIPATFRSANDANLNLIDFFLLFLPFQARQKASRRGKSDDPNVNFSTLAKPFDQKLPRANSCDERRKANSSKDLQARFAKINSLSPATYEIINGMKSHTSTIKRKSPTRNANANQRQLLR